MRFHGLEGVSCEQDGDNVYFGSSNGGLGYRA